MPLTDESSPACVIGAFEIAVGSVYATDTIAEALPDRRRLPLGGPRRACARRLRAVLPARLSCNHLTAELDPRPGRSRGGTGSPARQGGRRRLRARRLDAVLLAAGLPRTRRSSGFDAARPVGRGRPQAGRRGGAWPTAVHVRGRDGDHGRPGSTTSICFFDCLHDMGDPVGAPARTRREHLAPGGTRAARRAVSRPTTLAEQPRTRSAAAYYGFSTLLCTPSSLSQDVGAALGAQAGESRLRSVVTGAGFARLRRVAETPFNLVLEATCPNAA